MGEQITGEMKNADGKVRPFGIIHLFVICKFTCIMVAESSYSDGLMLPDIL